MYLLTSWANMSRGSSFLFLEPDNKKDKTKKAKTKISYQTKANNKKDNNTTELTTKKKKQDNKNQQQKYYMAYNFSPKLEN